MRAAVLLAFVFTSCAVTEVSGPYRHSLSTMDVRQIRATVAKIPDIEPFLRSIDAVQSDRVYVETGKGISQSGWVGTGLYLTKQDGHWSVDRTRPFAGVATRTIVTY
jgi:hypothetical protein